MATTNLTAAQQQAADAALASTKAVQATGAAASAAALANKASSASDDFGFYDSVWDSFLGNNDKYKWSKLDGVEAGTKSRNVSAQAELANSLLKPSNKTKMLKSFQTSILDENLRSIGGMPATGVAASDKPMVDGGPGRVFMEHHITNGHFITFSPGRLKWKLTDKDKDDILGFKAPEGAMENLGDFSKGLYKRIMSGQLAKFIYEPVAYRSAVGMAHAMAIEFMGLNGTMCKIGSRNMKLGDMTSTDWAEVVS